MAANPSSSFRWPNYRGAGVLLHPTSFPGDFAIGTFGNEARTFIDFLFEADFHYWQVCPLGPTGYGDSPYQCFSAFAGNPYLIDLPELIEVGLLRPEDVDPLRQLPQDRTDYGGIYNLKWPILRLAYDRFHQSDSVALYGDFSSFKNEKAEWLEPFVYYQALKKEFGGKPWYEWPNDCNTYARFRELGCRTDAIEEEAEAQRFYQYLFFGQWKNLRRYAAEREVQIIGDIPIFVSRDSADAWSHPEIFQFDSSGLKPRNVAGVPPDYFSEDGQYWGNPLFDWDYLEKNGYNWWKNRLAANFDLYDIVRIDHFRGFEAYWSIPFGSKTAKNGKWVKGPGLPFFLEIQKAFPEAKIIAEDLGTLTPEVFELLQATALPGMAVLQFAFGGPSDNFYLPHNLTKNSVIYAGTHDNDTTLGWFESIDDKTRDHVRNYLRISGKEIPWDFLRTAYASVCQLAIVTLQDLMNLDSSARFNTPGVPEGNWQWRYAGDQLEKLRNESSEYLREIAALYGRDRESRNLLRSASVSLTAD